MKFGVCTGVDAVKPENDGRTRLEKLSEIGFDYAEMGLSHIAALEEDVFNILTEKLLDSPLKCEACNVFFPGNIRLTGENVDDKITEEYILKALDRARRINVKVLVFGSGGARNVPEGYDTEKAFGQLVHMLRDIAGPIAQSNGIVIAIEPLDKRECNIINFVSDGLKLAKEVNHPNIKLLADYYHMACLDEDCSILEKAGEYLVHTHIARPGDRKYPGMDDKDLVMPFLDGLKKAGYNARISLEGGFTDFYQDCKNALDFLKKFS